MLAGFADIQEDRLGPLRLQTRFGNVSVLNARENLFRRARRARTRVQEERFLEGTGNSVTYIANSYEELDRILDVYYPMLVNGERFVILFDGKGCRVAAGYMPHYNIRCNANSLANS